MLWLWANMSGWVPLPGLDPLTDWVRSWGPRHYWLLHAVGYYYGAMLAVLALVVLTLADGPRATGLRPRLPVDEHLRVTGRVLGVPAAAAVLVTQLAWIPLLLWPQLFAQTGNLSFDMSAAPLWFTLTSTIANAVWEEAMLLGVFYRLLEYIPLGRKRLAHTVWGILLLAAMRTEYHSYQGIALIWAVLPFALLITQYYRGYRALIPIIAGHALYDQWIAFLGATSRATNVLLLLLLGWFLSIVVWAWTEGARSDHGTRRLRRTLAERRAADREAVEDVRA